jgi:hypothetical protein
MLRGLLEVEFDLETGVAGRGLEGAEGGVAAHALHEDADEVEADAGAAGVGAFGEEGAGGGDGGGWGVAVVADGEDDLAGVLAGGQFDAEGVAGGVPGAVIEEIAEDDLDCGGVGEHVGIVDGAAGLDGALEGWFPVAEDVVDGLGEVEGLGEDVSRRVVSSRRRSSRVRTWGSWWSRSARDSAWRRMLARGVRSSWVTEAKKAWRERARRMSRQ